MSTLTVTENVVSATINESTVALTVAETPVNLTVASGAVSASESVAGVLEIATAAEAAALTATNKALTPSLFADALGGVDGELIRVDINGLVGDGTTDDTAALQTILTANQGSNDIILKFSPNKTYLLDTVTWSGAGSLTIDASGATFKLKNSATNAQMFSITNPTEFHILPGATWEGNSANQTDQASYLVYIEAGANTTNVSVCGQRFSDILTGGVRLIGAGGLADGAGADNATFENNVFDNVSIGAVQTNITLSVRGNHARGTIKGNTFYNCSTGDATVIMGLSAEVTSANDWVGSWSISDNICEYGGTPLFLQKIRKCTVTNLIGHNIARSVGGTDYNANFIKIDDAGGDDSDITLTNCRATSENTTYTPSIRIEESGSDPYARTKGVKLYNCLSPYDIVAGASGEHRLTGCTANEDIALSGSGSKSSATLCNAGVTFNIQSAESTISGCIAPSFTVTSDGAGSSIQGGNYYSGISDMNNGATDVTVSGVNFTGSARLRLQGDRQFARSNTIVTTSDIAIQASKVGATEIVIESNTISAAESFTTTPGIYLQDPLEVIIKNNTFLSTTNRGSIGRIATTQSIRGEIRGNRGVRTHRNLNTSLGDLILDDNGYWNSGTWTPLSVTNHPTGFTGHG